MEQWRGGGRHGGGRGLGVRGGGRGGPGREGRGRGGHGRGRGGGRGNTMPEFLDLFNISYVEAFNMNSERFVCNDCGVHLASRSDLLKRGHDYHAFHIGINISINQQSLNFSNINICFKVPAFCICQRLLGFQLPSQGIMGARNPQIQNGVLIMFSAYLGYEHGQCMLGSGDGGSDREGTEMWKIISSKLA